MKCTKKINARVTPEIDRKLRELVAASGSTMSGIIMEAIERFYQQGASISPEPPYQIAKRLGVIGSFRSGQGDLSIRYKEIFADSVEEKL